MWNFSNPVQITFGSGQFSEVANFISGRPYALVTYKDKPFVEFASRLENDAGPPILTLNKVSPNPSYLDLEGPCNQMRDIPATVIIALGGGSVIDTAKVLALASSGFEPIREYLENKSTKINLPECAVPIIAIPTTAGTGSEVTKWATVWDTEKSRKHSLSRDDLYPTHAIIDPELMLPLPLDHTISTGLDALSHSLESIWNINANPISSNYAIGASRRILNYLHKLANDLENLKYRTMIAEAALYAGLAFSNTRTALAHSLSYPITLHHGIPHGIACSFTLPAIMSSVIGTQTSVDVSLREIFGEDLEAGIIQLETFIKDLNVPLSPEEYGIEASSWRIWVANALDGERGLNFVGEPEHATRALHAIMS